MTAITVEESRRLWLAKLKEQKRQPIEYVSLDEASGRMLAEPLCAGTDIPAFRKSPYDGFAIAYGDGVDHADTINDVDEANEVRKANGLHKTDKIETINEMTRRFKVIGSIGAGETFTGSVGPGEAVRIMTGAPIPDDCDTVIMQERCRIDEQSITAGEAIRNGQCITMSDTARHGAFITVSGAIRKGDNIVPQGEECREGQEILPVGTLLDGAALSVAAGLGYDQVPVFKQLKILVLTTGREIVPVGQPLQAGQIYNSNYYLLTSLLREQGFTNIETYHVSDAPHMVEQEIAHLKRISFDAEVIISTGGVSVGDYDYMPRIYEALGAEDLYTRIHMRPGAASYGGIIKTRKAEGDSYTLCFGLSGNPAAAFNGFYLLALPILKYCQGFNEIEYITMEMQLDADISKHNPFDRYVQGRVVMTGKGLVFRPNQLLTSSALLGLWQVNGLAKLAQGHHSYKAGDRVPVMLLKISK